MYLGIAKVVEWLSLNKGCRSFDYKNIYITPNEGKQFVIVILQNTYLYL